MEQRIDWIDYAKGIGIILVVYGHVLIGVHDAKLGLNEHSYLIQHNIIYGFHMPLFFFLSGLFVEKWKDRKFTIGIGQKLKTLIYPYILWSLLQGGIMVVLSKYINTSITWKELALVPIFPLDAQFWFIYDLFFIFLIFYGLRKILSLEKTFLVSLVIFLISPYLHGWELNRICFHLIFFVGGAVLFTKGENLLKDIKLAHILIISILFTLINYLFLNFKLPGFIFNVLSLFVATIGISLVVVVTGYLEKFNVNKILKYLGKNSMVIYLVHILTASGSRVVLSKLFHIHNVSINIFICTFLGILVPIIVHYICGKLRLNGLLFGELNKKTTNQLNKLAS